MEKEVRTEVTFMQAREVWLESTWGDEGNGFYKRVDKWQNEVKIKRQGDGNISVALKQNTIPTGCGILREQFSAGSYGTAALETPLWGGGGGLDVGLVVCFQWVSTVWTCEASPIVLWCGLILKYLFHTNYAYLIEQFNLGSSPLCNWAV